MGQSVEERLARIEGRLVEIESALRLQVTPTPAKHSFPSPSYTPVPPPVYTISPSLQQGKPGNWLGILAVICFVLAAAFIIKLSIESGWLTPIRQLGIATLFGFALIISGFMLMRTDRAYASLLPGAGIIVLYLIAFSAHAYYLLISFQAALITTGVISGFCIWLYTRIGHDAYAITAAVGAYIAPAVLGVGEAQVFSLYYFLFCSLAFSVLSVGVQSRLLTMISAYLAIFMTACAGMHLHRDTLAACMLATHFIVFATGTYAYTIHTKLPITRSESSGFLPVLLLFYVTEYYFLDHVSHVLAPWVSLAFAAFLIGLYLGAKSYFEDKVENSQLLVTAFVTLACFHSIYLELLPGTLRPWLLPLALFTIAFPPTGADTAKKLREAFPVPAIAIGAIIAIEYMEILGRLVDETFLYPLPVAFVSLASIWAVLTREKQEDFGWMLLGTAHILAMFSFYRLTYDYNSLAVSATWLIYAVCVIAFAFMRHDEDMAKSALLVLSIAAGKALIYDVSSAPPVVRILCLLLTGIVLYISGMLMRRIAGWKK